MLAVQRKVTTVVGELIGATVGTSQASHAELDGRLRARSGLRQVSPGSLVITTAWSAR